MKRLIHALKSLTPGAALACVLLAASTPAPAEIIGSFINNGDGTITYLYEINNSEGAYDVAAWSLDLGIALPDWDPLDVFSGGDVAVPDSNWFSDSGTPISGEWSQDFLSLDPDGDVSVGTTVGGFSFTSSYLPGSVTFHQFSALGEFTSGITVGPVAVVPEAGGCVCAIALASLMTFGVRRRRATLPA